MRCTAAILGSAGCPTPLRDKEQACDQGFGGDNTGMRARGSESAASTDGDKRHLVADARLGRWRHTVYLGNCGIIRGLASNGYTGFKVHVKTYEASDPWPWVSKGTWIWLRRETDQLGRKYYHHMPAITHNAGGPMVMHVSGG